MTNYIEVPIPVTLYKLLATKPVAIAATHQLPEILFDLGVFERFMVNDVIPLLVSKVPYDLIETEEAYVIRIAVDTE